MPSVGTIPNEPKAKRMWVRHRLEEQGFTFASLAQSLGVTRQCVHKALYASYPRMEKAIAEAIGLEPSFIWPERYCVDE